MKRIYAFTIGILISSVGFSQQGNGGLPFAKNIKSANIDIVEFSQPDIPFLKEEDRINDSLQTGPWRFGYNITTDLSLNNSGTWFDLPNGGKLWRLKVKCQNALTVNLTFDNVSIPQGNEMFVYNEDQSFVLGSFTDKHVYKGQLGTELVPGEVVFIEYYVSAQNLSSSSSLRLNTITHGYRTAKEFSEKAFGTSGNCNMNAICDDGIPFNDQIRSAVMLVSGSNGFCSGALINNTLDDGTPYVLTANHCYSNPTNWIFRFNWQSSTCANPNSSPSFESLSGATLRARGSESDFCLVEITGGLDNGTVPNSYQAFFAGWNNEDIPATSAVGVHHPDGDIKKISFDDDALVSGNGMNSPVNDTQWEVVWDRNTTTEGGSSGSPLFNQNGQIIGQLWGGGASCWNLSAPDYYGKLSYSWDPSGSSNSGQLKHWLDPNNSGNTGVDGFDPVLSIDEMSDVNFKLFPNPSNGSFAIEMDQELDYKIVITDLNGQQVDFNLNANSIEIQNVSSGFYFVQIITDLGRVTEKIIVE